MSDSGRLAALADRDGPLAAAAVGAVVTVVFSVIPFSPLLGGAVAAGRYGGGYARGVGVGALSGIAAAFPLSLLLVPALWLAGLLGVGIAPGDPAYAAFLAVVAALFLGYAVGLSALGGLAGVSVERYTGRDLDPVRWL